MSASKTRINSEHGAQQTGVSEDAADLRVCHSTAPLWQTVGHLFAEWVNSRPLDESIAPSIFFKHLANAFDVGLVEVQVSCYRPAVAASHQVIAAEWNLAGNLDALRAALKASHVDVHEVSLAEASK